MADIALFRPDNVAEAVALLGSGRICLAGGGVVVPGLRHGVRPAGLVSLRRLGLRGIAAAGDGIRIGAMTPHADTMSAGLLTGAAAVVRKAAAHIAHPAIRSMATIGGSVVAANPAADFASALLAADARYELVGPAGARIVSADAFVDREGRTALARDEVLTAVLLPGAAGRTSCGYRRFSRVDGDFPILTTAVRIDWQGESIANVRIAIGGAGPAAFRLPHVEADLRGVRAIGDVPDRLLQAYAEAARPADDIKASAAYRRRILPGLLRQALAEALAG